jgi:hypothetical protein
MEIDRLIKEKRSQIAEAFAAHQNAREAVAQMRNHLSELLPTVGCEPAQPDSDEVQLAKAQLQELESAEHKAATRLNAISEELALLHREKYGSWHITWIGPRQGP